MLDIWIVFWRVCDDVMHIVVPLPPSQAQSSQVVCNYHTNDRVAVVAVCYAHMTCIMSRENQLVPE